MKMSPIDIGTAAKIYEVSNKQREHATIKWQASQLEQKVSKCLGMVDENKKSKDGNFLGFREKKSRVGVRFSISGPSIVLNTPHTPQ